jgi:nitrogen fixation/metabolism regulation signal transduction histidine kinase
MVWPRVYRAKLSGLPKGTSRWLVLVGALSSTLIGLGLLVLMTQATGKSENYNQNYEWLVITNAVVAGGLLLTILWGAVRLWLRFRQGQFGARLLVKLAGIFALLADLRGVLPICLALHRKLV